MTHGVSREGAAGATQRRRSCGFRSLRVVVVSSESSEKCHALRHQSLEIFPSGLSRLSNSREALLYRLCVRRKRDCSSADGVRKPDLADKSLGLCRRLGVAHKNSRIAGPRRPGRLISTPSAAVAITTQLTLTNRLGRAGLSSPSVAQVSRRKRTTPVKAPQ